jgi:hypothetical protein
MQFTNLLTILHILITFISILCLNYSLVLGAKLSFKYFHTFHLKFDALLNIRNIVMQ